MATKKKAVKAKAKPAAKAKSKSKPAAKAKARPAAKAKPAKAKAKVKRTPSAAFMRPYSISATLQPIVGGATSLPRTEVTKRVWQYIKKNNLQDPKARRNINADTNLQKVFGGKKTLDMFQMTKMINNHLS